MSGLSYGFPINETNKKIHFVVYLNNDEYGTIEKVKGGFKFYPISDRKNASDTMKSASEILNSLEKQQESYYGQ
jgi:hypothetical protein